MEVNRRETQQRKVLLQVLKEANRPLSPHEILELAQNELPRLGLATVYRNVKSMVEDNVLKIVELPGESQRFELAGKYHHHHFHCKSCDKVFEVEDCNEDVHHTAPSGFEVEDHIVVLYGRCESCKNESVNANNSEHANNSGHKHESSCVQETHKHEHDHAHGHNH